MSFSKFNALLQNNVAAMASGKTQLYVVDVDKDLLWDLYLDSFPEGTNEIFRERREYDCSCCRQFVRNFGDVVAIVNNEIVTIWDFDAKSTTFQPVIDTLAAFIKNMPVANIFVTRDATVGTVCNFEKIGEEVTKWDHFHVVVPAHLKTKNTATLDTIMSEQRSSKDVLKASLEQITMDAVDTILELIASNTLYRGEQHKGALEKFKSILKEYAYCLESSVEDNFCWVQSQSAGPAISRIKNTSIGTLLLDLSGNMDVDTAVSRYEKVVAPTNYKRPKAIFTARQIEAAQKEFEALGFMDSLARRFAQVGDITVNNVLFANRNAATKMDGFFGDLTPTAARKPKSFDGVETMHVDAFVGNVLPTLTSMKVFLENRHQKNMMSLIAPVNKEAKTMFRWSNNFAWAYAGNVTDSLRDQVQALGGRVDGVFRFSHTWNYDGQNQSLMDLHVFMPGHIGGSVKKGDNYGNGRRVGWNNRQDMGSGGIQDVDFVAAPGKSIPVENITFPSLGRMPEGTYTMKIHNWSFRSPTTSGFKAEIEFDGNVYSYEYPQAVTQKEWITVAEVTLANGKFTIKHLLPESTATKNVWGLNTGEFHPVNIAMMSPNYWDDQKTTGNKHFFFMLEGCVNPEQPNGFFNEFLTEELSKHKRVLEAMGSRMKVQLSDNQLSGLGFSASRRDEMVVEVESNNIKRIIKVTF